MKKRSLSLNALITYVRFVNKTLMIRNRYTIGIENLPAEGSKYFLICNHQNCGNDPFNILFGLPFHWNICVMVRANVFSLHPLFTKLLNALNLIPAFRNDFDGADSVEKNNQSFDLLAERVNGGYPLLVFPEGGHTQGHYFGPFTTGFVRMAFYAAEKSGWQDDIKIVPTAHHYEDYFDVNSDFMWTVGKPISLKPYYEEYQAHPYKVMRRIKNEMHEAVHAQMLDLGEKDYEVKDFLRNSIANTERKEGMTLPERLKADQRFAKRMEECPDYDKMIAAGKTLKDYVEKYNISDKFIKNGVNAGKEVLNLLFLIIFLPLFIVALWPNGICYKLPLRLLRTDKMFTNTYRFLISALVLYPLAFIITLAVLWGVFSMPLVALIWILLWFPLGLFANLYYKKFKAFKQMLNYLKRGKDKDLQKQMCEEIEKALG